MKKYELVEGTKTVSGSKVQRIRYLRDIPEMNVKAGMLGGYIENESSLSHEGICVVLDDAVVSSGSMVKEDAVVSDEALVLQKSIIAGNSFVSGFVQIRNSKILDNAVVVDDAKVSDSEVAKGSRIFNNALVQRSKLDGSVTVKDDVSLGFSKIQGTNVVFRGNATVADTNMKQVNDIDVSGSAILFYCDFFKSYRVTIQGQAKLTGNTRSNRLYCAGSSIVISGDAILEGTALLVGDNIYIGHHGTVIGTVRVGDDVEIIEMACVENQALHEMFIEKTRFDMDVHMIQKDT